MMGKVAVDHIGVVVEDLDEAVARYQPVFGPPARRVELAEVGLRVAEFETANLTIEFLQYTGRGDGFARRVMGDGTGLNHISLRVDDLDRGLAEASAAGLVVQEGFPRPGAHGTVVFFERDPRSGLLLELCEPGEREDGG